MKGLFGHFGQINFLENLTFYLVILMHFLNHGYVVGNIDIIMFASNIQSHFSSTPETRQG